MYIYIFIYLFKYTWLLHLDGSKPTGGELVPFKRSVSSRTAISYSKSLSQGRDVPNGTQDIQSRRNYEKLEVNDLKKVKLWNYEKSENSHFLDHFMMVPWLFLTTVFHHRFYQWWRKNGCNSSLFKCTPQKVDNIILHIYIYIHVFYIYIVMCHNVYPTIFPTAGITMFDSCFLGILDYHLDQVAKTWGCLSDGMLWYAMGWIIRNKLVHGTGKINKSSTQYPLVNSQFAIKHGKTWPNRNSWFTHEKWVDFR